MATETDLIKLLGEAEAALIWMSGSSDFAADEPAGKHWAEIRDDLIPRMRAAESVTPGAEG